MMEERELTWLEEHAREKGFTIKQSLMHYSARRGEQHPNSKLTRAQIAEYRRRHEAGESIRSLAREAVVDHETMRSAINGRTYRNSS